MPVVSDFADLFVAVSEYVGRADFAHLFPRFVSLAELEIERAIRVADQHKEVTLTLINGRATLPTDFYAVRSVQTTALPTVHLNLLSKHTEQEPTESGPYGYVFDANEIVVVPSSVGSIVLDYFTTIPKLSAANPTNWLLQRAPDLILSGVVYHTMAWAGDDRQQMARDNFMASLGAFKKEDKQRRFTNGRMTVEGGLP